MMSPSKKGAGGSGFPVHPPHVGIANIAIIFDMQ